MRLTRLSILLVMPLAGQTPEQPVRAVTDPGVVTTRQAITPAGVPAVFQGRVYGVAFGAQDSELWVLGAGSLYRMDWLANKVLERVSLQGSAGLQGIVYDTAGRRPVFPAVQKGKLRLFAGDRAVGEELASANAGALATNGKLAVVPLIAVNEVAVYDLEAGRLKGRVSVGKAPFGAVMNEAGTVAYVSNWGGRAPRAGDQTAPTGLAPDADRVVVDARGIASTGILTRVDLVNLKAASGIPVGLHPTALAWDEKRGRLYVANTNQETVSVIDTAADRVIATIDVQPFAMRVSGVAPTALALSPSGDRLYVACGGINAVVVIETQTRRILGAIPTAWYPNHLAVNAKGTRLAVSSLLGAGSGWREAPSKRFVHAYRGAVSVIEAPDAAQLASYTTAVAENNRVQTAAPARQVPVTRPVAIPARTGDASFIEHVVFIIKENRTYDQVFGDMPRGNGDPSLVMFGENVTPNQHRMAEQFVLLDNFYATGGNSGDGHQWLTQANETSYCLWPGYQGRSYPFDGSDPIAYSASGFLWDLALKRGRTVRVYGEYAGRLPEPGKLRQPLLEAWRKGEDFTSRWKTVAPIAPLNKILAANYPPYTNAIPDVVRASIFLADVKKWESAGAMPNLVIVQLPCNHTFGTSPGLSTPSAMVADNDLALGQIVEALTHTRFWKKMAILVVEDDAQNGVDHVDGHRTVALAVSPYVRRGHVDSTFYSHQSMLKTIELILGLPTLSLFDMIATDMRNSFTDTPDYTPYTAVTPKQSLDDLNPPLKALRGKPLQAARDSLRMRWEVPDAAPVERLNRILWHTVRGWDTPYPAPRRGVFAPLSLEEEEGEEF